jgi:hypothetical protein
VAFGPAKDILDAVRKLQVVSPPSGAAVNNAPNTPALQAEAKV